MAGKRRGVGYCLEPSCAGYARLLVLAELPECFGCPSCGRPARLEPERGVRRGGSDVYEEVRVEFDFDPERGIYRQIARVRDARLLGRHDIYTLQSPLIRAREHARRVGRIVLQNLNDGVGRPRRRCRQPSRGELVSQGWPVLV